MYFTITRDKKNIIVWDKKYFELFLQLYLDGGDELVNVFKRNKMYENRLDPYEKWPKYDWNEMINEDED